MGAFTWSSLRWFQSLAVRMKKMFLRCSVFELRTGKGLEFRFSFLFMMFFSVNSWNLVSFVQFEFIVALRSQRPYGVLLLLALVLQC